MIVSFPYQDFDEMTSLLKLVYILAWHRGWKLSEGHTDKLSEIIWFCSELVHFSLKR